MKNLKYPAIMAIWNVTPDSFSSHFDQDDAASMQHALDLCQNGAEILDIGAESTRPNATPVPPDEEIERLKSPLAWARENVTIPISLDSYHPETIAWALSHNYVDIINDVGVSESPEMQREGRIYSAVRDADAHLIVMAWNAHDTKPMDFEQCMKKIVIQLEKRVEFAIKMGVDPDRIIVDPGIGFGKGLDNDLRIISESISALKPIGCPVLIGHSRKRCIAKIIDKPSDLDIATAMASAVAFSHGASIVRVHNPALSVIAKRLISSHSEVSEL